MSMEQEAEQGASPDVAIIGMSGRFPGADDLETFWRNLRDGVDSITFFTDEELRAAGVPEEHLRHPDYVRAVGKLSDVAGFDAGFFGYSPREAELLEPGHRLFLECAWEAMEAAGYDPSRVAGNVGVFAGVGSSDYTDTHIRANPALVESVGAFQMHVGSGKDFLATRASYKLNLRGPSLAVQTGCSTSLVSVHLACQSLLHGESDMALAGGSRVMVPQVTGYLYQHGSILSPDGRCRAFDERAAGAQAGSGVGVVLLKRLDDALRDGDTVHAVIRGSAVNNDGSVKVAYTAPSVEGQAAVITEALAMADVEPESVSYVEAHGTGTELGDPIEIAALTRAFRASTDREGFCVVGSVKTNIGHLDTAAGIAGLIKTVLAMEHGELPPTVHFTAPNPRIPFAGSPFRVSGRREEWRSEGPRRAGVSSFGIGGTNAHVVLEEAPAPAPSSPGRAYQILPLSARGPAALDRATDRLAAHLRAHGEQPLADVAFTLQEGRRAFSHRRFAVVRGGEDAAAVLEARTPDRVPSGASDGTHRSVAFLFPGLGDHYVQMGRGLYETEPVFRAEVDRCASILLPLLGTDVREVLFPGEAPADPGADAKGGFDLRRMLGRDAGPSPEAERLNRTELAQPAVFVVSYALARLWISLGVEPEAVIGHSLGEYTAACVAGVLELEDALRLVAERARLIQGLPGGAMLAVSAAVDTVRSHLPADVQVATVNAPELCVVAGPHDAVAELEGRLTGAGIVARRLATTHAFHSAMMEPATARFAEIVGRARLSAPRVPMVSNLTGTWLTAAEATDPQYWVRHLRETVRFDQGVAELLREPNRVLLEVGPGQTLSTFVRQRPAADGETAAPTVASVRYPYDRVADEAFLLGALGRLWIAGVEPRWSGLRGADERRRRVPLPTYPWERQRYWVDAPSAADAVTATRVRGRRADPADWLYLPAWRRTAAPAASADAPRRWVVLGDGDALAASVAAELRARGAEVTSVRAGDAFSASSPDLTARPGHGDDARRVVESVPGEGALGVLHLWSTGPRGGDPARGLPALASVADALGRDAGRAARLVAVTDGAHEVAGTEAVDPARAAVPGAIRCIPMEYAQVAARAVDLAAGTGPARAAQLLVDEALGAATEPVVAFRGRRRWVAGAEAVRPAGDGAARIREGGAYLLTRSVEGRGLLLAAALVERGGRLLLLAPELPARERWDGVDADSAEGRHVAAIRALEAAGAAVHVVRAPLADADALDAALRAAEAEAGSLRGVLHGFGHADLARFTGLAETEPAGWTARVETTLAELAALERVADARAPDFVLLESSLAPQLGSLGYGQVAALDAVVDAFAVAHNARAETPWTAVAWDRWGGEGDGFGEYFVGEGEVGRALAHVLSLGGESQVVVSSGDVELRAAEAAAPARRPEPAGYERPDLGHEYHAPTNEVEERIATMWQELLGISQIGIHDDFFHLGGHSLLATQIISRVREMFQLELPLKAIFEAPTPARFAVLIEQAIVAELEGMSEEDVLALL